MSASCTVDHRDGNGNPIPCPDRPQVTDTTRLAALLHDEMCGGKFVYHASRREWPCNSLAACLIAAGVTLAATPAPLDVTWFRAEFLRLLTVDSETKDRRRRDFNQAIFDAEKGWAVFNGTDLDMVMAKFDKAAAAYAEKTP